MLNLRCEVQTRLADDRPSTPRVTEVSIAHCRRITSEAPLDWSQVAAAAAKLRSLRAVTLGFSGREDLLKFSKDAEKQLAPLLDRCQVRYAARGEKGMWYQTSSDLRDLRGTPNVFSSFIPSHCALTSLSAKGYKDLFHVYS